MKPIKTSKSRVCITHEEVYAVPLEPGGDTWVVAIQDYEDWFDSYDCCGVAVEDHKGVLQGCCAYCEDVCELADRVNNALAAVDNYAYGFDHFTALLKVLNRTGAGAYLVYATKGGMVCENVRYTRCPLGAGLLVVAESEEAAEGYARELVARMSGYTWRIGRVENFDADNFDFWADADDTISGIVFRNVDMFGMSYPTDDELKDWL